MKGILAILMAGIMLTMMVTPATSEDVSTGADVNDVVSTYNCSGNLHW